VAQSNTVHRGTRIYLVVRSDLDVDVDVDVDRSGLVVRSDLDVDAPKRPDLFKTKNTLYTVIYLT
jgi:hypothetical protein